MLNRLCSLTLAAIAAAGQKRINNEFSRYLQWFIVVKVRRTCGFLLFCGRKLVLFVLDMPVLMAFKLSSIFTNSGCSEA
jgi:hypothetical protein